MLTEVNQLLGFVILINDDNIDEPWEKLASKNHCAFIIGELEHGDLDEFLNRVDYDYCTEYKWNNDFHLFVVPPLRTIYKCILNLDISLCNVAVISSDFEIIKQLQGEPFGTILISEDKLTLSMLGFLPDIIEKNLKSFIKGLEKKSGYYSEKVSIVPVDNDLSKGLKKFCMLPIEELNDKVTLICLGRYYRPEHVKHKVHQLSFRILKSKNNLSQESLFCDMYLDFVKHMNNQISIDGITRVPPRPSDSRDRFIKIVNQICKATNLENFSEHLICKTEYPKLKQLNKEARKQAIINVFESNQQVDGKTIVLIDDIWTTGSTSIECAKTLLENGAKKVFVLVLGVNQFTTKTSREEALCECNGTLIMKLNKNNNAVFFGCNNYYTNNCRKSIPYNEGRKYINSLNRLPIFDYDDSEDF